MMNEQARDLGELIRKAREVRGLTTSQLAQDLEVSVGWVVGLEQGVYKSPSPDRLARLAEVLKLEPSRIDRITMGSMSKGLPGLGTYFRAKFNLTDDEIDKIEHYVRRFTEKS